MKYIARAFSALLVAALAVAVLPAANAFAVADTTPPTVTNVLAVPNPAPLLAVVTVTANVEDIPAESAIVAAELTVNGGAATPMTPVDGTWDQFSEDVTGTFVASTAGTYDVCVRGKDDAGNWSLPVCTSFTAASVYTFTGFRPPIRNAGMGVKAGRTLPVKFRLTMASSGAPVGDASAIIGVMSYAVDCTTLTGDATTAVAENGPGHTRLRSLGRGNWIFNWKTPKSYKGTCRLMFVSFADGSMSPTVLFRFR